MENCIIDFGYKLGCQGMAGVKSVYIGTYNSDIKWTLDPNNKVIGVAPGSPTVTVYKFDQMASVAGFTQTGVYGENRTTGKQGTLNIKLDHYGDENIEKVRTLTKAYIFAIVESEEGAFVLLGKDSPGAANADTSGFGVAPTDLNGADITFAWNSGNGAYAFDGSILGSVVIIGPNS